MRFRSDVQGLRCVAVLPVLLYHFGVSLVPGGFTGVDIFFTISGFVIAGSIVHDIDERRFSVANFYFKRIRRVFPALAVVLAATTATAALLLLPDDLTSYGWSLLSAGTFWSNVYFWKATGYFEVVAQNRPLLHTWSLSVEEQFYVVAPIAFWLIHRHGGRRWLTFLLPVAIASLALGIWSALYAPTAGFFVLPTRAWELLTGAMLGLAARPAPANARVRDGLAWAGAALVGYGLFALHEGDPFPGWNALFPCVGTALIIHAGTRAERLPAVSRWLSAAPVLWIGDLSYSLYLVHWPIAALTRYRALTPPTPAVVVLMTLGSVGLAALIWRFVEQPFRRIGPRHGRAVLADQAYARIGCASSNRAVLGINHRDPAIGRWPVSFDLRLAEDIARQAREAGVAFADPTAALCGAGGVCTYRRGTTWFYSDDGHLSPLGSAIAVRRLWPAVAAIR